eukprot:TRINITY_DN1076_c0_g1_i2.p1 TRINITY_DN1076_c0_g1~~TRINITY_DN1076_c0_g1_i2.p1  ORF type:complete len:1930 (-),score=528.69 TRINITY_DN1076_c0_g1_i2:16-5805(-)
MGQVETREEAAHDNADRGAHDRKESAARRPRPTSRYDGTRSRGSVDDDDDEGSGSHLSVSRRGQRSRSRSGGRASDGDEGDSESGSRGSNIKKSSAGGGSGGASASASSAGGGSWMGSMWGTSSTTRPRKDKERESEAQEQQMERIYLDLSCRGLKTLTPAPRDLAPFCEPPHRAPGLAFRYLEALSMHNNFLTSLQGLEKVLHLPLLIELDISDNTIETIDDEIWEFLGSVERLNLACNKVEYLSSSIASMSSVAELNMASNSLVYLPNEIGRLSTVSYINVSSNQLHALPESLNGLHNLRKLLVSNNYLEVFIHPRPGDLRNLVWLDLSWNKIKTFPSGIGNLGATLEKLYLGHNELKALDGNEIRKLKVLRELSVPHNKLRALPQQLGLLTHLIILDIEENNFVDKEYKTTDVQDLLAWLKDPRANPIKVVLPSAAAPAIDPVRTIKSLDDEAFRMEEYKNQLYRLKGNQRIIMQKVQVHRSSLNEGDSFILDVGHTLFVYHGPDSNARERAKATYTARLLSEEELAGVPVVFVIDDQEEAFWEALSGYGPIASAEDGGDDGEWERHFSDGLILYKFSKEDQVDVIEGFESPFFLAMLNSSHSYVLESGENVFTWCGKDCSLHNRTRAMYQAEELASEKRDRGEFAETSFVIDGAETIYFREQFSDWTDDSVWTEELELEKKRKPATVRAPRGHIERPKSSYNPYSTVKVDVAEGKIIEPVLLAPEEVSNPSKETLSAVDDADGDKGQKRKMTRKQVQEMKKAAAVATQNEKLELEREERLKREKEEEEQRIRKAREERRKKEEQDRIAAKQKKDDEEKARKKKIEDERLAAKKRAEDEKKKKEAEELAERKRKEEEEAREKERQKREAEEAAKEKERKRIADEKERIRKEAEAKEQKRLEEERARERERIMQIETAKERKKREAEEEAERKRKEAADREKKRLEEEQEKERLRVEAEKEKERKRLEEEKRKREAEERKRKEEAEAAEKERLRKEEAAKEIARKQKEAENAEREAKLEADKKAEQARQNAARIQGSTIQVRSAVTSSGGASGKPAPKFGAAVDICEVCSKRVYLTERISVEGKIFHNTCFRCNQCKNVLKPGNYASNEGVYYCKPHFKQLFAEKGDYSGGFGGKKPAETWAEKKDQEASVVPVSKLGSSAPAAAVAVAVAKEEEAKPTVIVAPSPKQTRKPAVASVPAEVAAPKVETKEDVVVALAREFPEIGIERAESAMQLFYKWDPRGTGQLAKPQYLRLMQQAIGANKFAERPIFQKLVELSFENADKQKKGMIGRKEFLVCYYDLFANERRQVALLLAQEFQGLSVDKIEVGLQQFEQYASSKDAVVDMDEFYQLKDELNTNLKKLIGKIFKNAKHTGLGELDATQFMMAYEEFFGQKAAQGSTIASRPTPTPVAAAPAVDSGVVAPVQERPKVQRGGRNPDAIFTEFRGADNLMDIVESFLELKTACGGAADLQGLPVYTLIKGRVGNTQADTVWQLLDLRLTQVEYHTGFKSRPPRAAIVGSGPGGLRTAIEFALLGAEVMVFEKRMEYSRNNLLHIWPSTIRDLKNIGGKFFHAQLCVGGIEHIAIRSMQCMLLKIALLLGVKFLPGVGYTKADELSAGDQPQDPYDRQFCWKIQASAVPKDKLLVPYDEKELYVNIIVGADGENSAVAKDLLFDRKIMQGGRAIGITANFVNGNSREEKVIREFGLLAVYNQEYFSKLKEQHNIDLENLVYYREQTHYFVMTAKMRCLVEKGVCRKTTTDTQQLLARDNLDAAQLEAFVRETATYVGIPTTCPFARNHAGNKDVAIFDFSKKQMAVKHIKLFGTEEGARGLATLVGDALIEPFWPLGTGANRAVLSALDTAWMVKQMWGGNQGKQVSTADLERLSRQWAADFKVMMNAGPEDLVTNFGLHTIAPTSRYKKNTLGHFH